MQSYIRLMDAVSRWFGVLASWALLAACLISAGNAILRYAFNIGSNAWLEVQWYLFGIAVFAGAPILLKLKLPGAQWQSTVIGRAEIWPVHRRTSELGGHLRSGLEDTFYLPTGEKVQSNGPLIEQLARYAREAGREVATPAEARQMLGLAASAPLAVSN